MAIAVNLLAAGLWAAVVVQDLRERKVSLVVLVALVFLSLLGHSWPWWVLSAIGLVWPWRRRAWCLAPPAIALGVLTDEPVPSLALAPGITAWALGWWGGADTIVLLALALRHGLAGLLAGVLSAVVLGVTLMVVRKQPIAWNLLVALPGLLGQRALDPEVPAAKEMPAAAALGLAGLAMEVTLTLGRVFL